MYDVIVVGARCAGAPIAMQLAKKNYRVLLVDKREFPSDMAMSTHLVHSKGVNCLRRWGLIEEIASTTPPITRFDVDLGPFSLKGENPPCEGNNAAYAPRRLILDDVLLRGAVQEGVEFRSGVTVTGLKSDGDSVTGIEAVDEHGNAFAEKSKIVIGADGPNSVVARKVQAKMYNEVPILQGTVWTYFDSVPITELKLFLREHEGVYAFLTSEGKTLVGANWSIDRFGVARKNIQENYWDLLRRVAPEFSELVSNGERSEEYHVGATRGFFRQCAGSGWALLGDAGHKKDPCTAQGITDAFLDVEILAKAVHEGLSDAEKMLECLNEYQMLRDARALPYYHLTCDMATFASPTAEQLQLYLALKDNQAAAEQFFGLVTEAVSPEKFFAPENMESIMTLAQREDSELV